MSGEKKGWAHRLRLGLGRSRDALTDGVNRLFRSGQVDQATLDELEELLIAADLGVETAGRLARQLGEKRLAHDITPAEVYETLASEITNILEPVAQPLEITGGARPHVVLVAGVNGSGKTTTIGKLAVRWTHEGRKVVIAAGDTFRAAAIEQLDVWAQRAGADLISQEQGSDAASVVYDAVHAANARKADVLIIDTAGRLHTKKNLMQELEKINRVATREVEGAPHEVLLVLDATTGQNAVEQARQFSQIAPVTGIALTKLDSSAKGGVVIAVRHELDIPVKLIGIGEQIDDLRDFDGAAFVNALLSAEDA